LKAGEIIRGEGYISGTCCTCELVDTIAEQYLLVAYGCPIHCPQLPDPVFTGVTVHGTGEVILRGYDQLSHATYELSVEREMPGLAVVVRDNVLNRMELTPLFRALVCRKFGT
jgi:hypothetical protein